MENEFVLSVAALFTGKLVLFGLIAFAVYRAVTPSRVAARSMRRSPHTR